jgi:hypothetical protein
MRELYAFVPDRLNHFLCNYRKLPIIVSSKNPETTIMNDGSFIKIEAVLINIIFLLD